MTFSQILFSEINKHEGNYLKAPKIVWINGKAHLEEA